MMGWWEAWILATHSLCHTMNPSQDWGGPSLPKAMAASYLYKIRELLTWQDGEGVLGRNQQVPDTSKLLSLLTRLPINRDECTQL